jgi:uncharacterized membrane protein
MTTKSNAILPFIDVLNEEGGLTSSDLGNIMGVSKATVSR